MEITGKVVSLLPLQKGAGKNGEWKKQEFILETQSQYPKKVCISLWGAKVDQYQLKAGDVISAKIDIESREFNGRWYTDVKAFQINTGAGKGGAQDDYSQDFSNGFTVEDNTANSADDLPF